MTTERKATLSIDGLAPVDFPIMSPTHGNDCVDIRSLGGKTGLFTYDSGFLSTASCRSKITFIDGDKGELLYRGYPIEQLAESCNFLEVAYLLKNGELPDASQKVKFENTIKKHTMVHDQLTRFYNGFRRDAHPMAVMVGVVGALSAFYHEAMDYSDAEHRNISFNRIVAKLPTIVAMAYKYNRGMPFMYPDNELDYTANFMRMMFGSPCEKYVPNPVLVRALDVIFTLHADHEQNASTSTVRLAGSSGANPFACISAGIACLWGPAHGGANEACLQMLEEIGDVSRVGEYIKRAKDKNDSFKLMGFGHRVYRAEDPRARLLRETARRICAPRYEVALEVERAALAELARRKPDRVLATNVEYWSAVVLDAAGVPPHFAPVLFACSRTAGWSAHILEQHATGRLIRPAARYIGPPARQLSVPV